MGKNKDISDELKEKIKLYNIDLSELTDGGDTGLRGNPSGELYIDKEVFFNRKDVVFNLLDLIDSE